MKLLVLHQSFPGQFGHMVADWLRRPGWDVRALARETAPGVPGFNGLIRYRLARKAHAQQHPYLRTLESATLHGQAVARELLKLCKQGFSPDAVLPHPGWGESLYAKAKVPMKRFDQYRE